MQARSLLRSGRVSKLYSVSCPIHWGLSNSSMDPMLPRIILFFLWQLDYLRCFSVRVILFLINSHSISSENSFLLPFCFFFNFCVSINLSRLLVVKRWQEININISINDANSIIIIFGSDLKNIDFKFFVKDSDRDGIALMQASKIPELMFEDGSWIGQLNEFGHVWLKPNHMPSNVCLLLQIMDESDCTWSSWLWKFQHFKHPIRDVA